MEHKQRRDARCTPSSWLVFLWFCFSSSLFLFSFLSLLLFCYVFSFHCISSCLSPSLLPHFPMISPNLLSSFLYFSFSCLLSYSLSLPLLSFTLLFPSFFPFAVFSSPFSTFFYIVLLVLPFFFSFFHSVSFIFVHFLILSPSVFSHLSHFFH